MSPPAPALAWLLLLSLGVWGCAQEEPRPDLEDPDPIEGVVPEPDPDPVPLDHIPPDTDVEPPELRLVPADAVDGWTGPGGEPFEVTLRTSGDASHLQRRIGTRTFPLPLRTSRVALAQYPCTSCHHGVTVTAERAEDAHRDIQAVHPAETATLCTTCHVPSSVERLVLRDGATVSLDHAYRLCAQCHNPQANDWAAGAHGKRFDGWRGRRVVMNCADCHDPHRPALEQRVPFPGPRIPRTRGRDP